MLRIEATEFTYDRFHSFKKDFPFTVQMVEKNDYTRDKCSIVVEYDDEIAVCIAIVWDNGNRWVRVNSFEVSPSHEHNGYGREMIDFLKSCFNEIYLTSMPGAIGFYKKNGFIENSEIENELFWKEEESEELEMFLCKSSDFYK